jgi:hypothetical protein
MTEEERKSKYVRFIYRTVKHIHRVQKNMVTLITKYDEDLGLTEEDCTELIRAVMKHDLSKFSPEQMNAYIELTDYYYRKKELGVKDHQYPNQEVKDRVNLAVIRHYAEENHHPNRLSMTSIHTEYKGWTKLHSIECACDLQAMAQEFNEGSFRKYFFEKWQKDNSVFFPDDYRWSQVCSEIEKCLFCFEEEIK